MSRLLLVRHGQSVWNAEGRIQGQACRGLSELGHAQSRAMADAVAARHPDARLVVSDLPRCEQTAAPLVAALAVAPEVDPRLRERSFGTWEGRLRDEVAGQDAERWQRFAQGHDVIGEIGGETAAQLADRVEPVLRALLEGEDGEVVVAVTHGGPVWQGLHRLIGLPTGVLGGVGNTAISELRRRPDDGILLECYNEMGHLPAAQRTVFGARSAAGAPPVGR